ncbi:MAG: nickel pincer cofactor biosynthesis protein LarB [Victivallaceae bacterium]|nr:nickel pincer cofactor biosynthesis protein LarB [Victivallaceae bacterium]NLK84110.1 nickel pincer cofactor biosynthesis protein LarB [Lentisphaerota bacterium]MDD3116167.1 nickel pincer cofactor biosynthesis protein LarB [Victivallaceae bacterium]MDD3702963.1 nickel pincer cofactor biosynthesis protein LarB [Victivallaceae bacterium]MDD4317432.1 nickel pincer cofactor biosynthesis protein LarB [Victivallaceae bacterium]
MKDVAEIIKKLADGEIDMMTAFASAYSIDGCADIGVARIDHHRNARCGFPEFIFGAGKTPEQICEIISEILKSGHPVLATRINESSATAIIRVFPMAEYDKVARTLIIRNGAVPEKKGQVAIVTAGTSDLAIAYEASAVLELCGIKSEIINDVGVAAIYRIFVESERLRSADAVIVIAGMEGALPSVVGGLVKCPVIAVPTSVGYGAALNGFSALLGMLNSCASGVTVVNIDNGFGAGCAAVRIINGIR